MKRWQRAPALVLAVAFCAGDFLGLGAVHPRPLLAVALLAVAMAARAAGAAPAFFALGWLCAAHAASRPQPPLGTPLHLTVRIESAWRPPPAAQEGQGPTARALVVGWRQRGATRASEQDVLLEWAPQPAQLPAPGSLWRIRGALRGPMPFRNRGVSATRWTSLRLKSALLAEPLEGPTALSRLANAWRTLFDRALPPSPSHLGVSLARAMICGDSSGIDDAILGGFRRSGLAHLLVVSGFNVAVLAALVWALGSRLPAAWRYAGVSLAAGSYLLLVGDQAPVERASSACVLAVLALTLRRPPWGIQVLALAAMATLVLEPRWLLDLSFQLSYAATAAMIVVAPAAEMGWCLAWVPRPVRLAVAATLAASVVTLPLTLVHFHYANWLSPLYNLVAGPWAALVFLAGLLGSLAAACVPAAGSAVSASLDTLAWPAKLLALETPMPGLVFWSGATGWTVLLAAAGCGVITARTARRAVGHGAVVALVWMAGTREARAPAAAGAEASAVAAGGRGLIVSFDVGQGDATLLLSHQSSGRQVAILIDGGGWPRGDFGGRVLLPALLAYGVQRLDVAIVSHPDRDHCQGLADVALYLPVGEVWTAPGWEKSACMRRLRALARRSATLVAGDRRQRGGWDFEVLGPRIDESSATTGSDNSVSLVLSARRGRHRLLMMGDLDGKAERWLAFRAAADLRADILKAGHHGSAASNSTRFLDAVRPRLAIVSAGPENLYGHPAETTLERLRASGARIWRTDRLGEGRWVLTGPPVLESAHRGRDDR